MSSNIIRVVLLLSAAGACGGRTPAPAGNETGTTPVQAPVNRDRDLITQQELSDPAVRAQSVLDAVRSLRPQFLTVRGNISTGDEEAGKVHVSIDNGRILGLDELRTIHAGSVMEIRYLSPAAAMQKFGGAAREGPVILVRTTGK